MRALWHQTWLVHVSPFFLKRRVPSSSRGKIQNLANSAKQRALTASLYLTPPSSQPSVKYSKGVGWLVHVGIQKEKPVRKEGTTKEHSRGKFA